MDNNYFSSKREFFLDETVVQTIRKKRTAQKKSFKFYFFRALAVFLLIAMPLITYVYFNNTGKNQRLAWAYFQQPQYISQVFEPTGLDSISISRVELHYQNQKFDWAITAMEKLTLTQQHTAAKYLAAGICHFMAGNIPAAKQQFMAASKNPSYTQQAKYHAALAYLQLGQQDSSLILLQQIQNKQGNAEQQQQIAKLIEELTP